MIKRIICVLCCAVLVLGLCACSAAPQGNETDTAAVMAAVEKFVACESFTINQLTKSTEVATTDGEKYEYKGNNLLEMSLITAPELQIASSTTITVEADGSSVEQITTSYLVPENGGYTEYFTDGNEWYKVSTDDVSYVSAFDARVFVSSFFVEAISFDKAGEDMLDSGKTVRYEGVLGSEELMMVLESVGYFYSYSTMSEKQQSIIKENIRKDLGSVVVKVWVDEASGYPVCFEVSLTDVLKGLEKSVSKSLGDKASEYIITDYEISMTVKDFNSVSNILLPADALKATVYEA